MPTTTHINIEPATRITARADSFQGLRPSVSLAIGDCEAFIAFRDLCAISRMRAALDEAAALLAADQGAERGAA